MRPDNKALLLLTLAVVLVATAAGAYFVLVTGPLPQTLPVPAGTVFTSNETEHWVAHFAVGPAGGRLVGAWTAHDGAGNIALIIVNGTVDKPWPPPPMLCPAFIAWAEDNGTTNAPVGPGPHTAYWNTGYCAYAAEIDVTQTLQVAPG